MKAPIRIVVPFRPFEAESDLHKSLPDFDWIEALRMLMHSADVHGHDARAITDVDTTLPVPTLTYTTTRRRLMLWTLEVCLRYIESPDFDRNTIMLDVDQLLFGRLDDVFSKSCDIGLLVRSGAKHTATKDGQPFLNGVQFWRAKSKRRLTAFYARALEIAESLPEDRLVWGADTDAIRALIEPVQLGLHQRAGLRIQMVEADQVLDTLTEAHIELLNNGLPVHTHGRPVLDFRWTRKRYMAAVYRASIGARTAA